MLISSHHSHSFSKGFTLIEMMVVSAIIMILTAVFLLQQSRFDSATILRSLAYSTALSVRQAQVYGTSVLGSGSGSLAFAPAYGLYFSASSPNSYVLFADQSPANGTYDGSVEAVKTFTLSTKYSITKICAKASSGWHCSDTDARSLQVLFKRPNPDAQFVLSGSSGPFAGDGAYSSAYVQVRSSEGTYRDVWINATGQVSVLAPNTDPS